jgi:peptidoglycan/xylan/chitin deacetylase (PgdA/CDA1 family)
MQVAITVDDLPVHGPLPAGETRFSVAEKMLLALKKNNIPEAYGFINASKYEVQKDQVEVVKLWRKYYPLANHTYTHLDINKVSTADFIQDIDLNEKALKEFAGDSDWHYFRYPFLREGIDLKTRNAVRQHLKEKNYKIAQVTIDFEDWSWNAPYARCKDKNDLNKINWLKKTYLQNATDILMRAEQSSKAVIGRSIPHILLLHVGAFDAEMIDELIGAYRSKGVEFVALNHVMKDKFYEIDPGLPSKFGSELQFQVAKSRHKNLKELGMTPYKNYPEKELEAACN